MLEGVRRVGDTAKIISTSYYYQPEAEVAVFYGFDAMLRRIFRDYRARGKPVVLVDLGYWGRRDGGRLSGYHKVSVNDRHPTEYFQRVQHDSSRVDALGLTIAPWRTPGSAVIVAGMSAKAALVEGFRPSEWEQKTISLLQQITDRKLIYRPKPSWGEAKPIAGAQYAPGDIDIAQLLSDCHAVVTHHSNVAIDGLILGVPAFCTAGAASPLACSDFTKIDEPIYPEGRHQLVNDLAFCQWTVAEIRLGLPWRHLKNEGLVP